MQKLDGNGAVQAGIPAVTYFGHPTEPEDASQCVAATEKLGTVHEP
jgi:hypothetical protein